MSFFPIVVLVCLIVWAWFGVRSRHGRSSAKFPPGPYPLPIIGNILQLGRSPHISLANLSKKYGPLMYLKLGSLNTIVVSSPEMAKQVLQKHDQVFSSRTVPLAAQVCDFHKYSMGFLPVGDQWRLRRKICKEHILSTPGLDATQGLRRQKLNELLDYVRTCSDLGRVINIGEVAFTTSLSLMSGTLFSYDFGHFDSDSSREVRRLVRGTVEVMGTPNVADFFPVLKLVDPQGVERKAKISYIKLLDFFQDIINHRLESRGTSTDLLEVLLRLSEGNDHELGRDDIRFLLFDLFAAGTDTTSTTVEWAMAELLRNPEKMSKLRDELGVVIGEHNQPEESDIPKLPYLKAVIKETLRRHPSIPLLIPHKAEADMVINGYLIPENAQVLVNVWAIGRFSCQWSNPESFEPERFSDSEIDYGGHDFELIPFGSGRRMCPGLSLANRMLPLILASLVHSFDWKLEGGMKPDEIDLNERFGITLAKDVPIRAVPVKL